MPEIEKPAMDPFLEESSLRRLARVLSQSPVDDVIDHRARPEGECLVVDLNDRMTPSSPSDWRFPHVRRPRSHTKPSSTQDPASPNAGVRAAQERSWMRAHNFRYSPRRDEGLDEIGGNAESPAEGLRRRGVRSRQESQELVPILSLAKTTMSPIDKEGSSAVAGSDQLALAVILIGASVLATLAWAVAVAWSAKLLIGGFTMAILS